MSLKLILAHRTEKWIVFSIPIPIPIPIPMRVLELYREPGNAKSIAEYVKDQLQETMRQIS
jgi:hypothetical protein